MDYGRLIGRAWSLAWRHRFLWALGVFAASAVGSCSAGGGGTGTGFRWRVSPREFEALPPDIQALLRALGLWASRHLDLILPVAAALLLLGVAFVVVSFIAQGGMARATADLALGRPITAREAWGTGMRLFWRYLGLWLLALGVAVIVWLVVVALFAGGFALVRLVGGPPPTLLLPFEGILGLVLAVIAALVFIVLSVALAYAQRAIAVEAMGPLSGLGAGFRLLRAHPGESLLVWLINLALGIAAGLVIAAAVIVLLLLLVMLGAVVWTIVDLSAALLIYAIVAFITWVACAWFLAAIANSFFWSYWTLAYLRLTGRLTDQLEVPAERET